MTQRTDAPSAAEAAPGSPSNEPGLRERKKQATREALRLAAARLAVLKGWEEVRVEDIAAEAGMSTRTFNNCDGPWTPEQIEAFERWVHTGMTP